MTYVNYQHLYNFIALQQVYILYKHISFKMLIKHLSDCYNGFS